MHDDRIFGWVDADSEAKAKEWVISHYQSATESNTNIDHYNSEKKMYWFIVDNND